VIIPARDAARLLPATLAAVTAQAAEVLVVDNGSRDATARIARAHGAQVVDEPRPGRARARNAGLRATQAERIAFLDADCVPDPGWLDALDRCLDEHDLAGGRVVLEAREPANRIERFDVAWRLRQEETIRREGWSVTANLGVRRELLDRLGGLDESWPHAAEDVDLCLRAADLGATIGFCAEAVVRHAATRTLRPLVERGFRHGYGSAQLARRHPGRAGRHDWRHPRPLIHGDWALRRFGLDDRPELLWPARADYAGRVAGSLWAELRRAR
jgi:GT2 family glycosyltransferase